MVKAPQALNASTKCYHKTQALMGATRLASGIKEKANTPNKGSQTALITRLFVSLCLNARRESKLLKKTKRDASPPISACVFCSVFLTTYLPESY